MFKISINEEIIANDFSKRLYNFIYEEEINCFVEAYSLVLFMTNACWCPATMKNS
jgi:hypothetical protein